MKLLYICTDQFKVEDGKLYALPAFGNAYWQKYLDVFEDIEIIGIPIKRSLLNGAFTEITDKRISVHILPDNSYPKDMLKYNNYIRKNLEDYISKAEAILIKPSTIRGLMAISIAKKLKRPYMIQITGDLRTSYKDHPNLIKRYWGGYLLYGLVKSAIKDCKYGLYVSEKYLPSMYPIAGFQCGVTNSVIPEIPSSTLDERIKKIERYTPNETMKIGLVGAYKGNRKGIDTAIKALSLIKSIPLELHILANGVEEDRIYWKQYAHEYQFEKSLFFDPPVNGVDKVLQWNSKMDLVILPSRSEGLPRCVVESISMACPCVVSNVCGLPELVPDEWIHAPEDYKKMSELVERMLSDKKTMIEAARANFEHSKKYTFENLRAKRNQFLRQFREYATNTK